jgi:hypothetical protein
VKHEEDARAVHQGAQDFRVATRLGKVVGWTFHVPREKGHDFSHDGFSWVDLDGNAPTDTFGTRHTAEKVLKGYLRMKRQAPVDTLEKRA